MKGAPVQADPFFRWAALIVGINAEIRSALPTATDDELAAQFDNFALIASELKESRVLLQGIVERLDRIAAARKKAS